MNNLVVLVEVIERVSDVFTGWHKRKIWIDGIYPSPFQKHRLK